MQEFEPQSVAQYYNDSYIKYLYVMVKSGIKGVGGGFNATITKFFPK